MSVVFHDGLSRCIWLGLLVFFLSLAAGCADKSALPPQPAPAAPYAILKFSAAMQLLAMDQQAVDTTVAIRTLRVSPGQHTLRFIHVNHGPEGSLEHAGQHADPFILEAFEGLTYEFAAKT